MDGIIPLKKPKGLTSHDCVKKIRSITGIKKAGHTGTLDPNVEGVLPICLGEATKVIPFLQQLKKVYIAEVTLGTATTTEDADGEVIERKEMLDPPTDAEIEAALQSFIGEIKQTPPMYSAVRVKGKRLYEYARENKSVERPERTVTIYDIKRRKDLEELKDNASFTIEVSCSKGTYIRTLAVDIGKRLGYPAHMSKLIRIETDSFTIDETVTFSELEKAKEEDRLDELILPVGRALRHLPKIQVGHALKKRVLQGQKLRQPKEKLNAPFVIMHQHELLAIYEYDKRERGKIKPVRVFNMHKSEGEKS
ncbi:MAG: tRNA pseudouridine(55) synthase TruB [Bacilli bacterium]|nr:tRNA pseudouridine(55) synthase TruB [Bacilli bacterium]